MWSEYITKKKKKKERQAQKVFASPPCDLQPAALQLRFLWDMLKSSSV